MSPAYEGVWSEWFGDHLGRGVFPKRDHLGRVIQKRDYYAAPHFFIEWIKNNETEGIRSFVSVQPFKAYEIPYYILTLFYDFDCKENPEKAGDEALNFKARLERFYNVKAIVAFSGNKGYHLYIFLKTPIGKGLTIPQMKAVYNQLMLTLPGNADYDSLDSSVVGDIKQLSRVPYTHHEKTGKLCTFVDDDRNPIMVLPGFTKDLRENGLSFELCKEVLYRVGREEREKQEQRTKKPRRTWRYSKKVRPCIEAVMSSGSIHTPEHLMKLAAVAELNANGWGPDRIIIAFMGMSGSDERKTSYFVKHAIRTGYMPFRCTKIQEIGGCLGAECRIYRRKFQ